MLNFRSPRSWSWVTRSARFVAGLRLALAALSTALVLVYCGDGVPSEPQQSGSGNVLTATQAVASIIGAVNAPLGAFTPVIATGGTPPYRYGLAGGALPAGLSFSSSTGQVSGTPLAPLSTTTFAVTVTDAVAATSTRTFDLTVTGAVFPLITTQVVPSETGTVNTALAFTPVVASGGAPPYAYVLTGGTLPTGMSFSPSTGQVNGTPANVLATTTFAVTATDATLATSTKTFTLTVNSAATQLTTTQTTGGVTGIVNAALSFTPVTANGGTLPYTFALTGGVLPSGISFNAGTGQVSGTPLATLATTTFTVTVTDAASATSAKTFTFVVNLAPIPLTTTQVAGSVTSTVNTPIAFTPVTANGGTAPYTFALSGGALPTGVSFSVVTGQLSGTPTTILATTTLTVTVTDAAAATSAKTFNWTVSQTGPPLTTTQAVVSKVGTVNAAIATFAPVTATGGTPPYTYSLSGGTLPAGMSFSSSTGQVSGTPTTVLATTTFTVTVTDAAVAVSSKTFTLTVNSALSTTLATPNTIGTVNFAVAFTPLTTSGGTLPYSYALTSGTLPSGVSVSPSTGQVGGVPTTTLPITTYTMTVTDAAGATSAQPFTLTVSAAATSLTTTQSIASRTGTANAVIATFAPVTASGGTPPYTYSLSGGTLPNGMSFSTSSGQVSGTPTAALATMTFTVTVTDAAVAVSSKTFTLTVNNALTTTLATPNTIGTVNFAVAFTPVTASGGTLPYSYAVTSGTLPSAVSVSPSTGQVGGVPTTTLPVTTYTMTVTDAAGATSAQTFTLAVNAAATPLTTTQSIASRTGTANAVIATFAPVIASGGTPPYTYSLSGGTLPNGMSFSTSTGQVSGTPMTALTTTTFTVTVTDAVISVSSKTFTLTVNTALATTVATPSTIGTVNFALAFTPVTASGGTLPYSYAVTSGILPSGVSVSPSTGQVGGVPATALATTTYTMTVTDPAGATSAQTFTLTVNSAASPLTTTQTVASRTGTVNTAFAAFTPVTANGGTPPYSYSLSGGTLPNGMSFSVGTGQVSGTPTTVLTATTFTVTVTDAVIAVSSKTFTLTVNTTLTAVQNVPSTTGTVNTALSFTPVIASGGTPPYAYALGGGTLPSGLTFNTSSGQVSGTPATPLATTTFTVTVTDAASMTSSKMFTLTVGAAGIADLVIDAMAAPATATIGGTIFISTTVRNGGTAAAGAFRFGLYFSADATITTADVFFGSCSIAGLGIGVSNTCSGSLTVPSTLTAGPYFVGAFADDQGQVGESNESNNTLASSSTTLLSAAGCGDVRDQIIAEYVTYAVIDDANNGNIPFRPICGSFTQTSHSFYFQFTELTVDNVCSGLSPCPWAIIRSPLTIASSAGYGLDNWRDNYGSARHANSAYRSPAHNASVDVLTEHDSRHMLGDAMDLNNDSGSSGDAASAAEWNKMVAAANAAQASYVELNSESGYGHVHADWRNKP